MSYIYCDEIGNTGEHLLDPEQPLFVLASNDYSTAEAEALLEHVTGQAQAEVKFGTLKRTSAGRARLARLLFDPRFNSSRIMTFTFHKRFLVFSKLVDLVMETLLHKFGGDLYKQGANIASANMLYYCVPAYCGEEQTNEMLQAFITLIRFRGEDNVASYVSAGQKLLAACRDAEVRQFLEPFFDIAAVPLWLPTLPSRSLDPAIPALFAHIDGWGRRKEGRFTVVHDESKPIVASEQFFLNCMAEANEASRLEGYDRRTFLFPLRATGLQHASSIEFPQIQLADICAGATANFIRTRGSGQRDELSEILEASNCVTWAIGGVFPSPDVTPEALDTDTDTGTNPVDAITRRAGPKS